MTNSGNQGPLGGLTHSPDIDPGTTAMSLSLPPVTQGFEFELVIGEIQILTEDDDDKFSRKWEVGEEVYEELGLAGQIAKKLSSLRYRKGRIDFKTGKLDGGGLVCTPFAKIFGALWFEGDPLKQLKPKTRSPAPVYAEKYGGSLVNARRMGLNRLIKKLKQDRFYSVVTYKKSGKRQHIFFLMYSNLLGEWVRIESTGWALNEGGEGPGPGIYKVRKKPKKNRLYQAWDWGPADKPVNPDLDSWEFSE